MKKSDGFTVDPHREGRKPRAWYSPHRAIITLAALLIGVAVAGALLGVVNSSNAEKQIALLNDRYLVLQPPVRDVRAAAAAFQVIAGPAIAGSTPDTALIDSAVADSDAFDKDYLTLTHLLALPGNETLAPHLSGQVANYVGGALQARGIFGWREGIACHGPPRRRRAGCRREVGCRAGLASGNHHQPTDAGS